MNRMPLIFIGFLIFVSLVFLLIMLIVLLIRKRNANRLGDYRGMEIIGQGGMSTVYRARNRILKRTAVVKVLDEAMMKERDLVYKFLKEGENIARINKNYPDIPVVKVLEYSEAGSDAPFFIAMEYLEGVNVQEKIKSHRKPGLKTKLHIIKEVARSLQAAHQLGIIHRDISPDNMIINGKTVTLIDFGIAKQEFSNRRTEYGEILGKPLYMSPEQCANETLTNKTDIYSLGAVLFFLLEGKPLYDSRNPHELLYKHRHSPIPDITHPLPGDLKNFLIRMLDKKPRNRPNAAEVVRKIESIIHLV